MAWAEGIEKATALIGASGAMPVIPNVLTIAADLAQYRGAMIGVGAAGTADDAALVLDEILVRKAPAPFEIDDADARAAPTGQGPGITCIDAARGRTEVALTRGEIGRRRWRVNQIGKHVVQQTRPLVLHGMRNSVREFDRRLDVGSLDMGQLA